MRIILEGADNSGKTTLAKYLQGQLGSEAVHYFHPGGAPGDIQAEMVCMNEQFELMHKHSRLLMDRLTSISQRVYNPHPTWDGVRADGYQTLVDHFQPILVYCRPSTDRLMRLEDLTWRAGESEEHKQKIIKNQHAFIAGYDKIMTTTPHVLYDFEDSTVSNHIKHLLCEALSGSAEAMVDLRGAMKAGERR